MDKSIGQPRGARNGQKPGLRTCLLALLVFVSVAYLFLRGLGAFLIYGDSLVKSDAVAVLGGGGEHRVVQAVDLIYQNMGGVLILTEPEVSGGELTRGSDAFRSAAIAHGLSSGYILTTQKTVSSTYEEAKAVRQLMEQRGLNSVIVVTDPFHTERTRLIFKDVFSGSGMVVRVHPVTGHWYRSGTWFLRREGWGHTIREYIKLLGYLTGIYQTLD